MTSPYYSEPYKRPSTHCGLVLLAPRLAKSAIAGSRFPDRDTLPGPIRVPLMVIIVNNKRSSVFLISLKTVFCCSYEYTLSGPAINS